MIESTDPSYRRGNVTSLEAGGKNYVYSDDGAVSSAAAAPSGLPSYKSHVGAAAPSGLPSYDDHVAAAAAPSAKTENRWEYDSVGTPDEAKQVFEKFFDEDQERINAAYDEWRKEGSPKGPAGWKTVLLYEAGMNYIFDFDEMFQRRSDFPNRRRKIEHIEITTRSGFCDFA